jgi:hypothetical protein
LTHWVIDIEEVLIVLVVFISKDLGGFSSIRKVKSTDNSFIDLEDLREGPQSLTSLDSLDLC